jgi:NTE family protein
VAGAETDDDVAVDPAPGGRGYRRSDGLQAKFDAAKSTLLESDGWPDPSTGTKELVADLALEGGGVKGIGLAGAVLALDEAGYRFRGVAGTSAGSIAACLIAAITKAGAPMTELKRCMNDLQFTRFMPEGHLHGFLDHHGGKAGTLLADAAILTHRMGLYPGDYLAEWLQPKLAEFGCEHFGDLRLPAGADPGQSLPPGHDYRLLVHTSDITRERLVRLPWDYPIYGFDDPDQLEIVPAIRASMSIPFFFEPVRFDARPATVTVPSPDGGTIVQHYGGGGCTWVDGGMLRNFPIGAFDRADGAAPRWPTIGIKLSSLQTSFPETKTSESSIAVGVHCLRTMMNEWDSYEVAAATAARTIFVDNAGIAATDFHLSEEQQNLLFLNGVNAATHFVIEMAEIGHVPRTSEEGTALVERRRATRRSSG